MTSTLSIKLNLSGGLSDQNVSFDPMMVDINTKKSRDAANKSNVIYFPPTIKIRKQEVLNAGGGLSPLQVFTSPVYTNKFLRQYTRVRGYKPLSIKEAEDKGIIRDNFEYFFKLLFPKNAKILLNNIAYTIVSAKIASTKIPSEAKKGDIMRFKMDVNLRVIRKDKDSMVNRKRQSCRNQRSEINATLDALGWDDIGFDERDEDIPKKLSDTNLGPLYTSSSTGYANSRASNNNDPRRRYYNPYIPPGYAPPGYAPPGYAPPGYARSGYARSGYARSGYAPPYNPYNPYGYARYAPPAQNKTAGGGRTRKRSSKKSRSTRRVHVA